jgi:5-methylcytosine-specific restriction endonuclease McrA
MKTETGKYKMTDSHKRKISLALKGKKKSPEHVRKMALTKVGNSYCLGMKHTEEAKERMRGPRGKINISEEERERRRRCVPRGPRGKCSIETRRKMSVAHRGSNHHFWKGGITKLRKRIRESFMYKDWRDFCFKRDGYTCAECGKIGGVLHVDHVKTFSKILEENSVSSYEGALLCEELWDTHNGRTLCKECHLKTETWGRKKVAK